MDLPLNGCFSYVSHLTADEVQLESQRLESIDLSFPDEDIEEGREGYANCIHQVADEKLAGVTFYHSLRSPVASQNNSPEHFRPRVLMDNQLVRTR